MNNIPIACYDISGMEVFPKNDCAIKVKPLNSIEENTTFLAKSIDKTFKNKDIDNLCLNAIKDLEENYDWQNISKKIQTIYKENK